MGYLLSFVVSNIEWIIRFFVFVKYNEHNAVNASDYLVHKKFCGSICQVHEVIDTPTN